MEYLRGGSVLWVDLTSGKSWTEPTSRYDKFIGGRGINAKIVYDHVKPGTKAYDPGNVIVFGTGPLTGTFAPGGGRTEITSKSPMNDLLGMSNLGGYWATELKYSGYDHLAVTGKADKPVYLVINDDQVEICDAAAIWGKDTYEVTSIVRKETKEPDAHVLSIGIAGENLVRYASVLTKVGDAAGKMGMGAVMGSKNLKAIAARGTRGIRMADPDAYFEYSAQMHDVIKSQPRYERLSKQGTIGGIAAMGLTGVRTFGNLYSTQWDGLDADSQQQYQLDHSVKHAGCFSCPYRCMDYYVVPGVGPAVVSCSVYADPLWKVKASMDQWFESVSICQRHGIDFNTVYATIGWAIELFERGILTEKDTDGLKLELGNSDAIITLVDKIGKREGIGDLLAEGSVIAAKKLGRGSDKYVYHTKGMPHQSMNQIHYRTRGLATAVGPRGDFLRSDGSFPVHIDMAAVGGTEEEKLHSAEELERRLGGKTKAMDPLGYEDKGKYIAYMERITAISDLLMHCKWHGMWGEGPVEPDNLAKLYSIGTGKQITVAQLHEAAIRLRMLERAYNLREGLTREDDSLPKRYFEEPIPGKFPDDVVDRAKFEAMKDEYYREMGFDEKTGLPTREALERLGLKEVADDLEKAGRLAVPALVPVEVTAG